jgi:[protein-PII] uridylyltransferase
MEPKFMSDDCAPVTIAASSAIFPNIRNELIARALSVERLLISTWRECFTPKDPVALLAVGGFGRAELFLYSDVDLLILSAPHLAPALLAQVAAFEALAWQLKLDLAISVRDVDAAVQFAGEDLSFMTSLLDMRLLCGDWTLAEQLLRKLGPEFLWAPKDFFAAKMAEQTQRHRRFSDTAYNNEPNLKEGPGGLRDLHTIRWIAQRQFAGGRNAPGWAFLQEHGFISASERQALEQAEARLSSIRQSLHGASKRKEERLLFDHQIALAAHFGFVDLDFSNRAVEQLMQRYFRAVGSVIRLNIMLTARFAQRFESSVIEPLDGGFVLRGGQLDVLEKSSETLTLESAFHLLARWQQMPTASGVGANYLKAVDALLSRPLMNHLTSDTENPALSAFLALLDAPERVAGALAIAATNGLLGRILPAFERVTGRMQYDLFHAYTVDQHTLFVLEKLEGMRTLASEAELPLAFAVWQRIAKPRLLFLAALFHDIAKGRGGDHSTLGAEELRDFGARCGMAENEIDLIAWLVQEHLTMSTTAQKRDVQDPAVVRSFALMVADRERLDHLYLLTVADIRGTNPKLWNGWKARLLEDLYSATRFALRQGLELPMHANERMQARQSEALELLQGEGAGRTQVQTLWQDFPEFAFLRHSPDELRFQTQAVLTARRFGEHEVILLRPIPGAAALELFVRVKDRSGIFATITAVLDRMSISVLGARIGLAPSGMTHDTFQLHDLRAEVQVSPRERAREVQMDLKLALSAPVLKPRVSKRVATRQQRHFQFPAQIEITTNADASLSILALTCPDLFGLLAQVSLSFFEHDVRVHSARIATFGERVEDFFSLSDADGRALSAVKSAALTESIRAKLNA